MEDIVNYSAIFEWDMNNDQAEVFRIAVIYEEEFLKMFGGKELVAFKRNTIPRTGDPRKGNLFRYCWRLRRELRGLLDFHDFRYYIRANLSILQSYGSHIEPNALCGDKAWVRWKVWKRLFDQKMADKASTAPPPSTSTTDPKLIRDIDLTKRYIYERCEGVPTKDKIKDFIDNGFMRIWVMTAKICQYYLMLSPWVAESCDTAKLAESCQFDPALINGMITQEVKNYFNHEFNHEHGHTQGVPNGT